MRKRLIALCGISAVVMMGAGGAAYAAASSGTAVQPPEGVYACVNATGQINYLEFREPIPHACEYGDNLWQLNVGNDVVPTPRPTHTVIQGSNIATTGVPAGKTNQSQVIALVVPSGSHVTGTPVVGITGAGNSVSLTSIIRSSPGSVTVNYTTVSTGPTATYTISVNYNYEN